MNFPTIGVIGAGQLARMMLGPATGLGINVKIFASAQEDSAAQVANSIVGDYKNIEALLEFAKSCDVVTFEHELVPQEIIRALETNLIQLDRRRVEAFYLCTTKVEVAGTETEFAPVSV
jgi:5-(carboxyamino)imidazole ribonucleotide synthase